MAVRVGNGTRVRRFGPGVSSAALLVGLAAGSASAATLQPGYSPARDNGGGTSYGRNDIITIANRADTITGDYGLTGTSARPFDTDRQTLAQRQANGEVVSGYDAVDGRSAVSLTAGQKTQAVTYPDAIRGTNVTTTVYDNDKLIAVDSTSTTSVNYRPTNAPVYGDLRIANIVNGTATIATGDSGRSIYDRANFALLTADSGSSLYYASGGSDVTYASRTAYMGGLDQNGLSQPAQQSVAVPVTTYSGIAFGNGDAVTDLASFKRYNSALIGQLQAGSITPDQYESMIRAAATTATQSVVVQQREIPPYQAPPTVSGRRFIVVDGSRLTTTAGSTLVGVYSAEGNGDGGSNLIRGLNGATIVNNGQLVSALSGPGVMLTGAGTTLTNGSTGVIGVGYETLDRSGGGLDPTGLNKDYGGGASNRRAVTASDGASVVNQGIVNVSNRDYGTDPSGLGKANVGIVVESGASVSNQGTILIGGAASNAADTPGSYRGAAGLVALAGGTATNAAGGVIRIGTTFAENAADFATVHDVASVNYANGMTSISGGGTLVNDGTIRIGSLAQNASGILVGGGSTATNTGTITIDPSAATTPTQRNAGITVLEHAGAPAIDATNAEGGRITVGGVNGVGLLVVSSSAGSSAGAANRGTITVDGGLSMDNLRNYAIYVDGSGASATQDGAVVLNGAGAIGVHARNGGAINVGANATLAFGNAGQVGYYLLGAGTTIRFDPATAPTTVSTAGSTGIRVEGGATLGGTGINVAVTGNGAFGIVASGASSGTTLDTSGATITVSGNGATGVVVEGGATGTLGATIALTGNNSVAAIVDGQAHGLDGSAVGSPVAGTRLASAASLSSSADGLTGYIARNRGELVHTGTIAFTGANTTGILVSNGGTATNSGSVTVASGTGILVTGAGSTLSGSGSATANDGSAALMLANGGSASGAGRFTGAGTAHAVLLADGAGTLSLGNATLTTQGSGNGIENQAGSAVRLSGTTIVANGSGSGIRTAVNLDPASTATVTAAGTGSTAFTFAGTGNTLTSGDLALPSGLSLTASGAGATGVRLVTTGSAALSGTVAVTSAAGGSALVAGPAASVTNSGTLRSASTVAPVVDLTGGTRAFTNGGTIAAPSATAVAIRGGDNGQAVTLAGGTVTGVVQLGAGADRFVMSGGTLTGSIDTGSGDDTATFRGLTDANLMGVTRIAGSGAAGGNDVLTFDNTQSTGTRRISGFNTVALTNGSTLTSDGDLVLPSGGRLTLAAGTTFFAGGGVNATVVGSVVNGGTIDLTNGSASTTDTLTVRGNYAGNGGALRLDTVLNASGPSDRLVIDGGTVTGTTTITIANAGGLGAQTSGNGITVVSGINGANTTATTTRNGFVLAGGHVDAGAYQYRLFASDAAGSQNWYLRTDAPSSSDPSGGTNPTPAYRPEVALLTGLPQQLRHQDLDMLGTYHQRMGDKMGDAAYGFAVPGRLWGRAIYDGYRIRNRNASRADYDGRAYGFQIGADVFEFGTESGRHEVGVFGGYLDGHASVRGTVGGLADQYAGRTDPNTAYAGGYWTYLANSGFYVDTVIQHSWYNGHAVSAADNRLKIDGTGVLGSVETGYAIPLSARLTIEPQAQLIAQGVDLGHARIPNAVISQHSKGTLTGRLGARASTALDVGGRSIQPYVRANLWKQFASTDRTTFQTDAAGTVINTRTSSLYGQAGAGLTVPIAANVALYGEGDYSFTLDHGEGVTGHAANGSIGVKMRF